MNIAILGMAAHGTCRGADSLLPLGAATVSNRLSLWVCKV